MQINQESLLETADTIQDVFANDRRFPQLLSSSNTRELAATPAPAEMEQPGTGVGAIPGEEPTRCVGCGCEFMGCPCTRLPCDHLYWSSHRWILFCPNCSNELESESEREIDNESVIEYDLELDSNSPGPDCTLSFNGRVMERARNLRRPSPYSLDDRPRRSSNRCDLGSS